MKLMSREAKFYFVFEISLKTHCRLSKKYGDRLHIGLVLRQCAERITLRRELWRSALAPSIWRDSFYPDTGCDCPFGGRLQTSVL